MMSYSFHAEPAATGPSSFVTLCVDSVGETQHHARALIAL